MYEKLDKLRDEVKRYEKRVADAQSKLKAAQEKLKEGEASQILSDVGALKMSPEELARVLELVKSGQLNQGAAANTETKTTYTGSYSKDEENLDETDEENKEDTEDETY
jgi:Skp family chaperone for outer membrane proteins